MKSKDDLRPILFMGVVKDAKSQRFLMQTPTTVLLKPGIQVTFGKNSARRLDFVSCEPALCSAEMPLDGALEDEIKAADTATVTWSTLEAEEVKVSFPLEGAGTAITYIAGPYR